MAEPEKQQIGDGSDNYEQAAGQMAKAAKQAGQEATKQTAVKGAEATANAAAATVKASVEGGKAASRNRCRYCGWWSVGRYPVCGMGNAPYSFQDTDMYLFVSVVPDYHDCFLADDCIKQYFWAGWYAAGGRRNSDVSLYGDVRCCFRCGI